ncbi:cytochrome P450 [Aspergillus ambiguus]|uniref:cytochrome P450 n=1 Tax=Aspergillus ambiguus TaxID=176160 RepID=UPI003CCDFA54
MLTESLSQLVVGYYRHLVLGVVLLAIVAKVTYELLINPLRKFPGPKLASVTRGPYVYHSLKGDSVDWIHDLHTTYGGVVRICPDELSYITGDAWKGIYGHASAGKKTTEKDMRFYGPSFNGAPDIIRAPGPDHSRFRRNFSNAFSDRALREQQSLICRYVDLLIEKLNTAIQSDPLGKIEMVRMYNLTTFDIMGDLTFGDPLDLLKGTGNTGWVSAVFSSIKRTSLRRASRYYPWAAVLFKLTIPRSVIEKAMSHFRSCIERVDKRVSRKLNKPDIWGLVLDQKESLRLTREEMYANSQIFMLAGTETTATALSGLTYQLLLNPDKLEKITKEVRDTFQRDSDIDITSLAQMKYLNACIEEGLRMYPPVPVGLPRLVPPEGMMICGEYVPGKTAVSVSQWAAYRSPMNFKRPNEFLPERWTDPSFSTDDKSAFQPFSFGPRNCLGKNLAYHEMRLILAKVLYNFDLMSTPESIGWDKQKTFLLWEKNQLMVQLKQRA